MLDSKCVWSRLRNRPPRAFVPPETHYFGTGQLLLSYLQCTNYAVICDQRANKSYSFVLLNASILGKYREKPSLRSASLQQLIEVYGNYRVFVNEILLEIGFIEISFISSIWPATRSHYSLNFGSEKYDHAR